MNSEIYKQKLCEIIFANSKIYENGKYIFTNSNIYENSENI